MKSSTLQRQLGCASSGRVFFAIVGAFLLADVVIAVVTPEVASGMAGLAIMALFASQLWLLSFWAVMGTSSPQKRLAGTVVVLVVSGLVPPDADDLERIINYSFSAALIALSSMFAIFALCGRWFCLKRTRSEQTLPGCFRFQFSLRDLFVATIVVASALGSVPLLFGRYENANRDALVMFLIWTFSYVLSGTSAIYSAFLHRTLLIRLVALVLTSGVPGLAFAWIIQRLFDRFHLFGPPPQVTYWTITINWAALGLVAVYVALVFATLSAVRACGFQLVSRAAETSSPSRIGTPI